MGRVKVGPPDAEILVMSSNPGWYDDGVTPGVERWFDGTDWRDVTRVSSATVAGGWTPGPDRGSSGPASQPFPTPHTPLSQPFPTPDASAPWAGPTPHRVGPYDQPAPPRLEWPAPAPIAPAGSGPSEALHWIVPIGRSWQSITSGYLGLIGLIIWPLAPFAVWLGFWAMRLARAGGHGRGRAVFGILTGLVGTFIGVLFLTVTL